MKIIVTHLHPDLDAVASAWLVKKYFPGWEHAEMRFVPAGKTLDDMVPDSNPDIIHVDTGKGPFDHHHLKERLSATRVVLEYIKKNNFAPSDSIPALDRLAEYATVIDNFEDMYYPSPSADVYDLSLGYLIDGLALNTEESIEVVERSIPILEAALTLLKRKTKAEIEFQKAVHFESAWGESIGILSANSDTEKLAQKSGIKLVVRKDPQKGFIRVKTTPHEKKDLSKIYDALKSSDKEADWFLHISGKMLLNGSSKNPSMKASKLSLEEVIGIINKI